MPHCASCGETMNLQFSKGRWYCPAHLPREFKPPTLVRVKKEIIKCWKCEYDVPADAEVCPNCGQDLRQWIEGG